MRPRMRRVEFTKASIFRVALQSIRWTFALLGLALRLGWDRFRKKKDVHRAGVHVRRMFENMGGVAIKLGQQLSARVDLLPFEVCQELGTLLDASLPLPATLPLQLESADGEVTLRALSPTQRVWLRGPVVLAGAGIEGWPIGEVRPWDELGGRRYLESA